MVQHDAIDFAPPHRITALVTEMREAAGPMEPAQLDRRPGLRPALWVPLLIAIVAALLFVAVRL